MRVSYFILVVSLSACQHNGTVSTSATTDNVNEVDLLVESTLGSAVNDIEKAARLLAQTNNAMATELLSNAEKAKFLAEEKETPPGFEKKVTLDWHGPLKHVVTRISTLSGYKIITRGIEKTVIIKIDKTNEPLIEIFRELKYQASQYGVALTAGNNTILLAYPGR